MKFSFVLVTTAALGIGILGVQGCATGGEEFDSSHDAVTGGCVPGGFYCGGDKVEGDKNSLFVCESGKKGRLSQKCATKCIVAAPGQDDACEDTKPCFKQGTYCGGDKVNGNPNALYSCDNFDPASTAVFDTLCGGGCQVMPDGQDDRCKPAPTCVANGTYCGGDKVDGDPNFLYKCDDSGKGQFIKSCDHGCAVRTGQDDDCKTSGKQDDIIYGMGPFGFGGEGD
jgi:hypothetical protein